MLDYDLARLFEHPLKFRMLLPSLIVTFGGEPRGERLIRSTWRRSAGEPPREEDLRLTWDTAALRRDFSEIEDEIAILLHRDEDQARRIEQAAVIVAVALMAHIDPQTRFTRRSGTGTRHDYYLNDRDDEMIEIAGRSEGGLPGLFLEKREQSDRNPTLRKRWVSVTIFSSGARNRTEGLHP